MKFSVVIVTVLFFVLGFSLQIVLPEEQSQSSSEDTYIAKFGDEVITVSYFNDYLKAIEKRQGMNVNKFQRETLLKQLIAKKMMYKYAMSSNFDKDPEVVAKINEATFEIISSIFLKRNTKNIQATDEDALKYYNEHMDKYSVPELYSGTIYFVYKKGKNSEDFSAKSNAIAGEIREFISDNNSAGKQDVMKTFTERYPDVLFNSDQIMNHWKGRSIILPENIVEKFLKLKKNEITVVEQNEYYAVIVMTNITLSKPDDFRFAKNKIITEIEAERYQKAYDELYNKIGKEYNLTVNSSVLNKPMNK